MLLSDKRQLKGNIEQIVFSDCT